MRRPIDTNYYEFMGPTYDGGALKHSLKAHFSNLHQLGSIFKTLINKNARAPMNFVHPSVC